MRVVATTLAVLALSTFGCSASVDSTDEEGIDTPESTADAVTYGAYHTLRHDNRKCISPICGGYWIKRANRDTTLCADGSYAAECYVASVDLASKLGLAESELAGVDVSRLVVRGNPKVQTIGSFKVGVLVASEAWYPGSDVEPTGTFYKVTDLGIRCVKAPCFSLKADKLSYSTTTTLSGISSGAGSALAGGPILAAGTIKSVSFPTGKGKELVADAFYTRLAHKAGACDVDSDCTATVYSANVASTADCYCRICPSNITDTFTAAAREASWTKSCSKAKLLCPAVKCMAPRPVACVANQCQAVE